LIAPGESLKNGVIETDALRAGMEQKAREFNEAGAEIYSKA
jgi:hypothetical protein